MLLGVLFLAVHFLAFPGSAGKLASVPQEALALHHILWLLGWWLNPLPVHSPYELRFDVGLELLSTEPILWLSLSACLACVIILVARASAWQNARPRKQTRLNWAVLLVGLTVFVASLLPFLITGGHHFRPRVMYLPLLGLAVAGAAAIQMAAGKLQWEGFLRWPIAVVTACFLSLSVVIDLGAQRLFAESWVLHRQVIEALVAEEKQILESGSVFVDGLYPCAYDEIAQLDTDWGFPCLVAWIFGDQRLRGQTNLMREVGGGPVSSAAHRIDLITTQGRN